MPVVGRATKTSATRSHLQHFIFCSCEDPSSRFWCWPPVDPAPINDATFPRRPLGATERSTNEPIARSWQSAIGPPATVFFRDLGRLVPDPNRRQGFV